MGRSKYTLESCIADASRFDDLKNWRTQSAGFYKAAHRYGWLDECINHLTLGKHIWTKDECTKSAAAYSTRKQWRSTISGEKAYQSAWRNGWLDECTAHMVESVKGNHAVDWEAVNYHFDGEKNKINKAMLTAGSHKKAWWICKTDPNHRLFKETKSIIRGFKCPYCGESEFDGKNSIALLEPDWLKEWDTEANAGLDPHTLPRKYPGMVNWICKNGHKWPESPKERRKNGIGCRICNHKTGVKKANKTRVSQRGSLLDNLPDVASYWSKRNTLMPSDYSAGSKQKVWLTKPNGETVRTTPKSLTKNTDSLYRLLDIITSGKVNPTPENSVAARHPELLLDWSSREIDPYSVAEFSGLSIDWVCHICGYQWSTTVASRSSGRSCPKCSRKQGQDKRVKKLINEQGSAADQYPELITQWNTERNEGKPLTDFTAKSSYRGWWICDYHHEWQAPISNRTAGSNCPFCAGRGSKIELRLLSELEYFFADIIWQFRSEIGELDLFIPSLNIGIEVDGYPWHQGKAKKDLAKSIRFGKSGIQVFRVRDDRLDDEIADAIKYTNNSDDKGFYAAIAQLLNQLPTTPAQRREYLSAGNFVNQTRYRKLLEQYPRPPTGRALSDVIDESKLGWDYDQNSPITPEMVYAGSKTTYNFICAIHGSYLSTPQSRKNGHGCKKCGQQRAARKRNVLSRPGESLAIWLENSDIQPAALPIDEARRFSIKSKQILDWACKRGHSWPKRIYEMVQRPSCPVCDTYEKSVAVRAPHRAAWWNEEANGLSPDQVKSGSGKMYSWKCPSCDHIWEDSPNRVAQKTGKKCPVCHFG